MPETVLEIRGDHRGGKASAEQIERALEGIERQAAKSSARASTSLGHLSRQGEIHANSLERSFARATGRVVLGLGAIAGGAGVLATVSGLAFYKVRQNAEIAFTTMLKSGERARRFLAELADFAKATPFEFPQLVSTAQQLLNVGFGAREVIPLLTRVGDAVAAAGGGGERLERTVRAIGQIRSLGRLTADEMNQLSEAGTFGWTQLADVLGVSVAKAREASEKGLIDADTAIAAFVANAERHYEGMTAKQARTMTGLASTLKDAFGEASEGALRPLFDLATRGMQRLADQAEDERFTAGVERFAAFIETRVVPAIQDAIEWIVNNRGEIAGAFEEGAEKAAGFAEALLRILRLLARIGDEAADMLGGEANLFTLLISGYLATRAVQLGRALTTLATGGLAATTAGAGAAAVKAGRLRAVLRTLGAIGVITIAIELLVHRDEFDRMMADLFGGETVLDGRKTLSWEEFQAFKRSREQAKKTKTGPPTGRSARQPGGAPTSARGGMTAGGAQLADIIEAAGGTITSTTGGKHTPGSHHYRGEALDLAPSKQIWDLLYAHKEKFIELFGPWGLYEWGKRFQDAKLQAGHNDHIHVAYTGSSDEIVKILGGGEKPGSATVTSRAGTLDVDVDTAGAKSKAATRSGPAKADPEDVHRFRTTVDFILSHLERVLPQARGKLRTLARDISKDIAGIVTDDDADRVGKRVERLIKQFETAAGVKRAKDTLVKEIQAMIEQIARLPEDMWGRLGKAWERVNRLVRNIVTAKDAEAARKAIEKLSTEIQAGIADVESRFQRAWGRFRDRIMRAFEEGYVGKFRISLEFGEEVLTRAGAQKAKDRAFGIIDEIERAGLSDQEKTIAARGNALQQAQDEWYAALESGDNARIERAGAALIEAQDQWAAIDEAALDERGKKYLDAWRRFLEATGKLSEGVRKKAQDAWEEIAGEDRQKVEDFIDQIGGQLARGEITWAEARKLLSEELKKYGIDLDNIGALMGDAFQGGLIAAINAVAEAVRDLVRALRGVKEEAEGAGDAIGRIPAPPRPPPGRAGGAQDPGEDPGVDPANTVMGSRAFKSGGGGGDVHLHIEFNPAVTVTGTLDLEELAVELAEPIRDVVVRHNRAGGDFFNTEHGY